MKFYDIRGPEKKKKSVSENKRIRCYKCLNLVVCNQLVYCRKNQLHKIYLYQQPEIYFLARKNCPYYDPWNGETYQQEAQP